MQDFQVSVVPSPPYTVVTVTGELDIISVTELNERLEPLLRDSSDACLLFDLAGLRFIDSMGIRVLLDACMRTRRGGGGAAFCGLSPHLRRLFALLGLTPRLTIHPTLEDALTGPDDACRREHECGASSGTR